MSSPEETRQAADLIERLLTDATFRAEFRRDPATACEQFGLGELAEELRGGGGSAKALYTLELRQSMSSLAGVLMAAAAEGIGALDLVGLGSSPDKQVAGVVNEALSRHSIKAISRAQMQAVEHHDGAGGGGGGAHHGAHGTAEQTTMGIAPASRGATSTPSSRSRAMSTPSTQPGHEHAEQPKPGHEHADGHEHAHDHAKHAGHPEQHAQAKPAASPAHEAHTAKDSMAATPAVAPPAEPHHAAAAPAPAARAGARGARLPSRSTRPRHPLLRTRTSTRQLRPPRLPRPSRPPAASWPPCWRTPTSICPRTPARTSPPARSTRGSSRCSRR